MTVFTWLQLIGFTFYTVCLLKTLDDCYRQGAPKTPDTFESLIKNKHVDKI